jgi:hypothetical protein
MSLRSARPFAILLLLLTGLPALGQAPAFLVRDLDPDRPGPIAYQPGEESEAVGSLF